MGRIKIIICIILFSFIHTMLFSQICINPSANDTLTLNMLSGRSFTNTFNRPVNTLQSIQTIPANFYAQHLEFFCRQELKMQQINVPLTFRVGTMDQCNYLEQKPGYKIY